jgi:hypothetical protein
MPAPRYVFGFDSPNGRALGAIPALETSAIVARYGDEWLQTTHDGAPIWIRPADVGMQIADLAPPAVVYVEQPQAAPGVGESSYQVTNDPPSDWYTDIATPPPGFVESLIGDDPNAPACGGSPLCGGLTNAQAQAARDQQQAGR